MNKILEQFISEILIGTGLLTSLAAYFKTIIDKKQMDKKLKLTDEHDKQHEEILHKLNFLYDNIKNTIFLKTLEIKLKKQLDTIIEINIIENLELINILNISLNCFLSVINDILLYDFDVTINQLNDIFKQYINNINYYINYKNLNIKNISYFIKIIKNEILIPCMKQFSYEFFDLKLLENGIRRNKLLEVSLDIEKEVIDKFIKIYNNYKEKNNV